MEAGIISDKRLPPIPIDENAIFTSRVADFAGTSSLSILAWNICLPTNTGQHVKSADKAIIKYLKAKGRLVIDSQITHSYPFCWRSDTPLIYRAVSSWFVRIPEIIPKMLENIDKSHWVPDHIKSKRFADWIKNARDWAVSRNRYWGTPIPLWTNKDFSEIVCVGSAQELKELSGHKEDITDLHRDKIDMITIPSKKGNGELRRIEEIFDCWCKSLYIIYDRP